MQTTGSVGFDKNGQSTNIITILTDAGERIITAYPGRNNESCVHYNNTPASTTSV